MFRSGARLGRYPRGGADPGARHRPGKRKLATNLPAFQANLRRMGLIEADVVLGGSDQLIEALVV
jgi:hypothetical protein